MSHLAHENRYKSDWIHILYITVYTESVTPPPPSPQSESGVREEVRGKSFASNRVEDRITEALEHCSEGGNKMMMIKSAPAKNIREAGF